MFNKRFRKDSKKENIAKKEEEIIDVYEDDDVEEYITEEEAEEEEQEFHDDGMFAKNRKVPKSKIITDIIFIIIMLCLIFVTVDIIAVGKYDKGPFFAIPFRTYKDGGTKEYYGLGYKVIDYNQVQGRRDKEIGAWSLKYNTEPITVQDIDLAIEFMTNEIGTYKKYYKKFLRIPSTLRSVDETKHQITLGYRDEDGKYSMNIVCTMVPEQDNLSSFEQDKEITIIGTVRNYEGKMEDKNNTLFLSECFGEQ